MKSKKDKIIKGSLKATQEASKRIDEWQKHKRNKTLDQIIDYDLEWEELFILDN